ncbi:MAG: RecQ family ATP-dependent DNA helicase [Meiothermus sp.]
MSPGFSPDLEKLLRERFGLQDFKPGQREAVEAALAGRRVLLVQPTGWGKSLVYQMVAAVRGLTVVFTPLRALMRDQVKNAGRYGLRAALLNSDQSPEEQEAALREAAEGRLELLFIAPERLDNALWKAHVPQLPIRAVVVDEAHCVSVWGHDFRPDYRRIVNLVRLLPAAIPVLAVTATATSRVEADILAQIGEATELLRGPLVRPNFVLRVVRVAGESGKLAWLAHLVQQYEGTGLVYCASRPMTELVAEYLNSIGIKAEYYHAGRDEERLQLERALMENRYKVIAATNALGMGLDKPDLRFVIHTEFPASPLHYYQEIGRAGRDGQRADLVLLYDPADQAIQQRFIDGNKPAAEAYRRVYGLLMQKSLREREILLETGLSQRAWRNIRSDLEDQNALIRDEAGFFRARPGVELDFSLHDRLRSAKQEELAAMLEYAQTGECRMAFLRRYLGDADAEPCGRCDSCAGADSSRPSDTLLRQALELARNPRLHISNKFAKQPIYAGGYALDYYMGTRTGAAIHSAKYEGGGTLPDWLVEASAGLIRRRYPLAELDGLTFVPPSNSGGLVEEFAARLSAALGLPLLRVLCKVRQTRSQKSFTNRTQKSANLKDAFGIAQGHNLAGLTLLVVDDVCDSGVTLAETGRVLRRAGAKTLYAFTLAKTRHADDQ